MEVMFIRTWNGLQDVKRQAWGTRPRDMLLAMSCVPQRIKDLLRESDSRRRMGATSFTVALQVRRRS